jgi:hypothetical protein
MQKNEKKEELQGLGVGGSEKKDPVGRSLFEMRN